MFPVRIRSTNNLITVPMSVTPLMDGNGRPIQGAPFPYSPSIIYEGTAKRVSDNGKTRFVPGKLSVNPFEVCSVSYHHQPGKLVYLYGTTPAVRIVGPVSGHGFSYQTIPQSPTMDYDASVLALARAYAKLGTPSIDMGVNIAEASKTLKMLRNPIIGFANLLKKIQKPSRKGIHYDPQGASSDIANRYLEYRFGFAPLFSDICNLRATFDRQIRPILRRYERVAAQQSETTGSARHMFHAPIYNVYCVHSEIRRTRTVHRATIYYDYSHEPGWSGATAWGLNPAFAMNLVWELIPYSFVVDRAIDIGTWLRTCVPRPNNAVLATSNSVKVDDTTVRHILAAYGGTGIVESPGYTKATLSGYRRNLDAVPLDTSSILKLRNPFADLKWNADYLALTFQKILKS